MFTLFDAGSEISKSDKIKYTEAFLRSAQRHPTVYSPERKADIADYLKELRGKGKSGNTVLTDKEKSGNMSVDRRSETKVKPFLEIEEAIHNNAMKVLGTVQKDINEAKRNIKGQINAGASDPDRLTGSVLKSVKPLFEGIAKQIALTARQSYVDGLLLTGKELLKRMGGDLNE